MDSKLGSKANLKKYIKVNGKGLSRMNRGCGGMSLRHLRQHGRGERRLGLRGENDRRLGCFHHRESRLRSFWIMLTFSLYFARQH